MSTDASGEVDNASDESKPVDRTKGGVELDGTDDSDLEVVRSFAEEDAGCPGLGAAAASPSAAWNHAVAQKDSAAVSARTKGVTDGVLNGAAAVFPCAMLL